MLQNEQTTKYKANAREMLRNITENIKSIYDLGNFSIQVFFIYIRGQQRVQA